MIEAQEVRTEHTLTIVRPRNDYRDYSGTRIYVWPENESVLDNFLVGRRARPTEAYRAIVKTEVFEALGIDPERYNVKWSRTAGCSCGCSPGFILTDMERHVASLRASAESKGYGVCDISVTIKACEHNFPPDSWACTECGLPNPEATAAYKEALNESRAERGATDTVEEAIGGADVIIDPARRLREVVEETRSEREEAMSQ